MPAVVTSVTLPVIVAVTASVFGSSTNVLRSLQPWIVQPVASDAQTALPAVRMATISELKSVADVHRGERHAGAASSRSRCRRSASV